MEEGDRGSGERRVDKRGRGCVRMIHEESGKLAWHFAHVKAKLCGVYHYCHLKTMLTVFYPFLFFCFCFFAVMFLILFSTYGCHASQSVSTNFKADLDFNSSGCFRKDVFPRYAYIEFVGVVLDKMRVRPR